jgi:voltage-gated potassium channel
MKDTKSGHKRIHQFRIFQRNIIHGMLVIREVLGALVVLIVLNGMAIAWFEKIPVGDAIYFSFVTAFTIGYGDISPETIGGRVLSLWVGLIGLVFAGLIVAVATRALADTLKEVRPEEEE